MRPAARTSPLFLALLAATGAAHAWPDTHAPWVFDLPKGGTNCTFLDPATNPVRYDVSFEGDIRMHLATPCGGCHVAGSSNGFNFNPSNARNSLIGPNETGAPFTLVSTIVRVRPGRPLESGFFLKVNCETPAPPYGSRMPIGSPQLSPEVQALIHDWIAAGALMPDSPGGERLFIGNFESIVRPVPAP